MNISQTPPRLTTLPAAVRTHMSASPELSKTNTPATTPTDSSQVGFSEAARKLLAVQHHNGDHDAVDTARVQALRAAVAAGEYPIDSGRIADGLLTSAYELCQAAPR